MAKATWQRTISGWVIVGAAKFICSFLKLLVGIELLVEILFSLLFFISSLTAATCTCATHEAYLLSFSSSSASFSKSVAITGNHKAKINNNII
jgi:hypothetical protein